MPAALNDQRETIVLEKTTCLRGARLPKGEQITFTFPAGTTDLLALALRNLKRVHPDENTMCWEARESAQG